MHCAFLSPSSASQICISQPKHAFFVADYVADHSPDSDRQVACAGQGHGAAECGGRRGAVDSLQEAPSTKGWSRVSVWLVGGGGCDSDDANKKAHEGILFRYYSICLEEEKSVCCFFLQPFPRRFLVYAPLLPHRAPALPFLVLLRFYELFSLLLSRPSLSLSHAHFTFNSSSLSLFACSEL